MASSRFGRLGVILVEVEGCVELGLSREQFLEARFVLERPVGLGLIVGQRFSSRSGWRRSSSAAFLTARRVCSML
jgi:hypothetical protein